MMQLCGIQSITCKTSWYVLRVCEERESKRDRKRAKERERECVYMM